MKKLAAVVVAVLLSGVASPAFAGGGNPQVCAELDSGKVDVSGGHKTVTAEAPEGFLIDGYCVKAGSVQQGNGPHYVTLDEPAETVTFGHPSGKDVSHYSVSWVAVMTPAPVEVHPNPPQFVDLCGVEDDEIQVPSDTDAVTYTVYDNRVDGVGEVFVQADATPGHILRLGDELTEFVAWGFDFTAEECPVEPPPEPSTPPVTPEPPTGGGDPVEAAPELPATGLTPLASWALMGGLFLLVAGGTLFAWAWESRPRYKREGVNE